MGVRAERLEIPLEDGASLGAEYFAYDEEKLLLRGERSRDVITFGVRFDVEVIGVDLQRRQIGFLRAGPVVKDETKKKASSDGRLTGCPSSHAA